MQEARRTSGHGYLKAAPRRRLRVAGWRVAAIALVCALAAGSEAAPESFGVDLSGRPGEPLLGPVLPLRPQGSSSFESGGFEEVDQANTQKGSLSVDARRASGGVRSANAIFWGGKGVGFARAVWFVDWRSAETVCFGGSFYLPKGFLGRISGTVDLLRWDNYAADPVSTDHGGLTVWGDGGLRLLREQLGRDNYSVLIGPVRIREERWSRLVVQQRLSPARTEATSVVYVDGRQVGRSNAPNSYGRPATAVRMGIVAVDARRQKDRLELRFDDLFYRDGPCSTDDV